ncbi:glycosyltransferase family 39 protein, partial [Stackebrandtia soli]|uniref:glycosyltransferase family 39 protein n=1 Tax=Stackebrandtia soli TaxID=1892856 RepID=UPI0039EB033F
MDVDASIPKKSIAPFATVPVGIVSIVGLVSLILVSGQYGWHRDELYFLAAADRLDFGYVDQPPLTPLLTKISAFMFGDTPSGVRILAAFAFVVIIVLAAMICRELGGGRLAQSLAAISAAACGQFLAVGHMVSTSTFDAVFWLALSWFCLRILRTGETRWWIGAGVVAGIGLQNKYLIGLLALSLLIGVLAVGPRSALRGRWPLIGIGIALVIAAPNLIWQFANGWPQLTVAGGISGVDGGENRILFLPSQLYYLSPLLVPVWLLGWWRLWIDETLRWSRPFAVAYPVASIIVLLAGGKGYYVAPLLLVLTAAGSPLVAEWVRRGRVMIRRVSLVAMALVAAASSAVMTLPLLPPGDLGLINTINPEQGEQVGWYEFAEAVGEAYSAIPAEVRTDTIIITANYGEAGAIEHYGPEFGLPKPYSPHMGYSAWG